MMKKYCVLFLSFLLTGAASAQRDIDLEVTLSSPASGDVIMSGSPSSLEFDWINNGPDTILAGDTMRFRFYIDAVQVDSGFFVQLAPLLPGYGMTIPIQYIINVPDSLTGLRSFCIYSFVRGAAGSVADPVPANNLFCNDSITFHNQGSVSVSAPGVNENRIKVYPVPAGDILTIGYYSPGGGQVSLILFDVTGRKVKEVMPGSEIGYAEWDVDISGLSNGNYFYSLTMGEMVERGRFCISR